VGIRIGAFGGFLAAVCLAMAVPAWGFAPLQNEREQYEASLRQWKEAYIELAQIHNEFQTCEESESGEVAERFVEALNRGNALRLQTIEQAAAWYAASPQNIEEINQMLTGLPENLFAEHNYSLAATVSSSLLKHNPDNSGVMFEAIKNAFFANRFDLATELADQWQPRFGALPRQLEPIVDVLPEYREAWQAELAARETREAGTPLPRLILETSAGTIVVELFEDDYPLIVNNLISLVEERNLYHNWMIFEVLEHQYIHGGCLRNDGSSRLPVGPVSREEIPPFARHFRGSFSLMVDPANSVATTQYFITRIPMPEFSAHSVVIGRVIEGMDIVDRISATHKLDDQLRPEPIPDATPDGVLRATVTQKRDHEYTFREQLAPEGAETGDN
jgi:cyclophilin family peptidyl-prolyl cis-trans isomerase